MSAVPGGSTLYVVCDEVLIRTRLTWESFLSLLRASPLKILPFLLHLFRGRASAKAFAAAHGPVDPAQLPYDEPTLAQLRELHAQGHKLVLTTSAHEKLAAAVMEHTGIFSRCLTTRADFHLSRDEIAAAIARDAAERGGTHSVAAIATRSVAFGEWVKRWLRALRSHQWLKNLLLAVPLLTAHRWNDPQALTSLFLAMVAFSLVASGIYVANDLVDLPSDRRHPRKRLRPFAFGAIPLLHGMLCIPVLLVAGLVLAYFVRLEFFLLVLAYIGITLAYSFVLKTYVLIDVITLAGLYTLRVIAGAAAIDVIPSFWLMAFSMFLFVSLALIKRYAELLAVRERNAVPGRGYRVSDATVVQSLGMSTGIAAVVVFSLFLHTDEVAAAYSRPRILWLLCVGFLYWISRLWLKTLRGEMHDDPLVYAMRDRGSRYVLVASVMAVLAAE